MTRAEADAPVEAHFWDVTEVAGEPISAEQVERLEHRYAWAALHCGGADVVEVACGTGAGLGLLLGAARSVEAGDISQPLLDIARRHYRDRLRIARIDAQALPFDSASKDVILLFEAIYYLPDATKFLSECRRVLRTGGRVLIATANKDLSDFSPSPHSQRYYGAVELKRLLEHQGFAAELFGHLSVATVTWRQRLLRPAKRLVVSLGLMPRTMRGKSLLKRLVFGRPVAMVAEIAAGTRMRTPPLRISGDSPDREHKVLYAIGMVGPR
jgi:ubiquinone/menaquinone biosynthesis C-methylase UbiE